MTKKMRIVLYKILPTSTTAESTGETKTADIASWNLRRIAQKMIACTNKERYFLKQSDKNMFFLFLNWISNC